MRNLVLTIVLLSWASMSFSQPGIFTTALENVGERIRLDLTEGGYETLVKVEHDQAYREVRFMISANKPGVDVSEHCAAVIRMAKKSMEMDPDSGRPESGPYSLLGKLIANQDDSETPASAIAVMIDLGVLLRAELSSDENTARCSSPLYADSVATL